MNPVGWQKRVTIFVLQQHHAMALILDESQQTIARQCATHAPHIYSIHTSDSLQFNLELLVKLSHNLDLFSHLV